MKKIPIDYVNITWCKQEKNYIEVTLCYVNGYRVLNIKMQNAYLPLDESNQKLWNRDLRKLKGKLRKFALDHTTFHMDSALEPFFDKQGLGFFARKQELIRNMEDVCIRLKGENNGKRKELLLIIGDNVLSSAELKRMLLEAKNVYEDITVCRTVAGPPEHRVFSCLEDEWGVVINKLTDFSKLKKQYESVILIIPNWKDYMEMDFLMKQCYVLCREPLTKSIEEMILQKGTESSHIYAGYCYFLEEERIPYQMAVDFLYQQQNEKFEVTSVAIYELK